VIKLIVTDMDGTFLNSKSEYDKKNFSLLFKQLKEKNVHFVACSGKQYECLQTIFSDDVKDEIWYVGDSATRIIFKGKTLFQSYLSPKVALKIIKYLVNYGDYFGTVVCTTKAAYIDSKTSPNIFKVFQRSFKGLEKLNSLYYLIDNILKITIYDPTGESNLIYNKLQEKYSKQAYVVASELEWLDISAKEAHKGSTIKKLQEILRISPEETLVFGDGENDIELMKVAKHSYAMANACDNLKKVARHIAKSNNENGVLEVIQDYLNRGLI